MAGYRGLSAPPTADIGNIVQFCRSVVDVIANLLKGKMNVTLDVTLTANSATTVILDPRIGGSSQISLGHPSTANAAAALGTTYVSSVDYQTATLTHANNAQADRTFRLTILG